MKVMDEIADRSGPATWDPGHSLDVQELLQSLPASVQVVLNLRIFHDMPFRDIGAVVGISTEAAKKRAQRGLKTLREKMRDSKPTGKRTNIGTVADKSSSFLKTSSPNRPPKRI